MKRGFWYNHGTGEIISAMFTSHLRVVIENPATFGVTSDFINAEFKKTRERHGIEGVARRQILLAVLENSGWVRWREMVPPIYSHRWSVEAWSKERWNPSVADLRQIVEEFTGEVTLGWERFELTYLEKEFPPTKRSPL